MCCMDQVFKMTKDSPEFKQFLFDPSIPKREKVPTLNAMLAKMEVSEVTKHFMGECRL